jgi:hypothetical protein
MSEPKRYTTDYTFTGTAFIPTTREVFDGEYVRYEDYARLKQQVERLTKAVMHSPAAQLKLKELEGKTTYEEINPDSNGF